MLRIGVFIVWLVDFVGSELLIASGGASSLEESSGQQREFYIEFEIRKRIYAFQGIMSSF